MPRPAPVTTATRPASMSAMSATSPVPEPRCGMLHRPADAPQRARAPDGDPLPHPGSHLAGLALRFLRPDPLHVPALTDLAPARPRPPCACRAARRVSRGDGAGL